MAVPLRSRATRAAARQGRAAPAVSTYREFRPGAELARAAVCMWQGRPGWSRNLRVLPDGCFDLVWDGQVVRVTRPAPRPIRYLVRADAQPVGIRIRPGWAGLVLGLPVRHLPDLTDVKDIWPAESARSLETLLASAPSAVARRGILTRSIVARLADVTGPRPDILAALHCLGRLQMPVEAVARDVGASVRQLRRHFDDHVGLPPKDLQAILRFQRFRARMAPPRAAMTLARAAAECGYFDQSHLVRECRRLAGATPSALLDGRR